MTANISVGGVVYTDELNSYRGLAAAGYRHASVNHRAKEDAYFDYRLDATISVNSI